MCFKEPISLLASPLNKLSEKKELTLKDIAHVPLILTEKGCSYRSAFESKFHKENLQPHLSLEIGSIGTIKNFVMNNLGITLLPAMTVEKELAEGSLVELDLVQCDFIDIQVQPLTYLSALLLKLTGLLHRCKIKNCSINKVWIYISTPYLSIYYLATVLMYSNIPAIIEP